MDYDHFRYTEAYSIINDFLNDILDTIIKRREEPQKNYVHKILKRTEKLIDETQLKETNNRYGNSGAHDVLKGLKTLEEDVYFHNAFGSERLDYGTGHELNFLCYLYTLKRMNMVKLEEIEKNLMYYFYIIRKYIVKFNIEPAGSYGIWGIDDYQLLPFIIGAAQNIHEEQSMNDKYNKYIEDTIITYENNTDDEFKNTLEFIIQHKTRYKKTPFKEHSKLIYQIKDTPWEKILSGTLKLYDENVFGKYVVMQHFIYTKYLPK